MRLLKKMALFSLGGLGYVGLELLWRRRSHGTMFLAGGAAFLLLGQLGRLRCHWSVKGILGSLGITGIELATGLLFNRDFRVWDYRRQPLNLAGQICLLYTCLWAPLSLGGIWLYKRLEKI